jgi:phosphate transport system substrate-binding protein
MTGKVVADIFLGRITKWNDPALVRLNQGKSLPNLAITTIHRSDNSGTTYNLTEYLNSVSRTWKSGPGKGIAVAWPNGVGARGSAGVSAALSATDGGITYVDVAFTLSNHFKFAAVQNRAGIFALPGLNGIKAAGATILRVADSGSVVNPSKRQKFCRSVRSPDRAPAPRRPGSRFIVGLRAVRRTGSSLLPLPGVLKTLA